jgi:preprotein translocase subunit SecD
MASCGGSSANTDVTPQDTSSSSGDLSPHSTLTLTASPLGEGLTLSDAQIDEAVAILRQRLADRDITDDTISVQGHQVTVSIAPSELSTVEDLTQTALLRFRQVLAVGNYTPAPVTTTAPNTAFSTGRAPSASLTETGVDPRPNSESTRLTTAFEAAFASWDCSKHPNPTNGNDIPTDYIIACDTRDVASAKYLLAPAALEGTDVKTASAGLSTQGATWQVNVEFTGGGSGKWLSLTKAAYNATGSSDSGFADGCSPPKGCNAVAIVLDGDVISAPAVQSPGGIPGGLVDITGNFTQTQATNLADALKYGSLPLKFTQTDVETESVRSP